ncbi:MAG: hypothetical protein Q9N62_13000 [Ghiorsea sp.]|nr:hypothetical protein [Ghiorsea sp.]
MMRWEMASIRTFYGAYGWKACLRRQADDFENTHNVAAPQTLAKLAKGWHDLI